MKNIKTVLNFLVFIYLTFILISCNNTTKEYKWMVGTWECQEISLIISSIKFNNISKTNGAIKEKKRRSLFFDANGSPYSLDTNTWAPTGSFIKEDTLYCFMANAAGNHGYVLIIDKIKKKLNFPDGTELKKVSDSTSFKNIFE